MWRTWICAGVILIILFPSASTAQVFKREPYGISISAGGAPVDHPFSGGFYNPVHQFVDIDGDGDFDLFLLDNNDRSVMFYRNVGTPAAPEFRQGVVDFSMPGLRGWFRFADINGDGRIDLLTAGDTLNTVAVYTNTGSTILPEFNLLHSTLRDSLNNPVYTQEQCISGLIDIDGDNDPDFFSLNPGSGTLNFYENVGSSTNFRLIFRTDFWMGIQICPGCGGRPSDPLHGQGTVYFADVDGDLDFDMFYGDLFDQGVLFFENHGTSQIPLLDTAHVRFPPDVPLTTGGFNQSTLVDIDADGDFDLFVSVLTPFQQVDNLYFYENTGTPVNFSYQLVTKNFLATFDAGLQSAPVLVDIDADTDLDLYVGDLFGHVAFLRNMGSTTAPAFVLEDSAVVSSLTNFAYAPVFTDIDGDGDLDLFLGHFAGNIEFHRNIGTEIAPQFVRENSFFDSVNVGLYAAPAFFDMDGDEDFDLLVGKGNGRISFYRNVGTTKVHSFVLESSFFQDIAVGFNAKPAFADADNDGDEDLVIGGMENKLHLYRNDGPPVNPSFTLVSETFGGIARSQEIAPAACDIDGDGDMDLIVGSVRGGLDLYRNQLFTSGVPVDPLLPGYVRLYQNYPNPFNPSTRIRFEISHAGPGSGFTRMAVFNVLGEEIATLVSGRFVPGSYEVVWDASGYPAGVYICRLTVNGAIHTRKMVLLK